MSVVAQGPLTSAILTLFSIVAIAQSPSAPRAWCFRLRRLRGRTGRRFRCEIRSAATTSRQHLNFIGAGVTVPLLHAKVFRPMR